MPWLQRSQGHYQQWYWLLYVLYECHLPQGRIFITLPTSYLKCWKMIKKNYVSLQKTSTNNGLTMAHHWLQISGLEAGSCQPDKLKWASLLVKYQRLISELNKKLFRWLQYRWLTGIILCMPPANERRRYNVTSSLIGWVHTQNNPWVWVKMLCIPSVSTFRLQNFFEKT